jgi:hypothetical protein
VTIQQNKPKQNKGQHKGQNKTKAKTKQNTTGKQQTQPKHVMLYFGLMSGQAQVFGQME